MLSKVNRKIINRADYIQITSAAFSQLIKWKKDILAAGSRKISRERANTMTLWSDASNSGWGAVLFDDDTQRTYVVGNKWKEHEKLLHINIKEARALANAIYLLEILKDKVVQPFIDNTSFLQSLHKERSKSEHLNKEITNIVSFCRNNNIVLKKPTYIRSAENPAYQDRGPSNHD